MFVLLCSRRINPPTDDSSINIFYLFVSASNHISNRGKKLYHEHVSSKRTF